jgi:hypothetical protein
MKRWSNFSIYGEFGKYDPSLVKPPIKGRDAEK